MGQMQPAPARTERGRPQPILCLVDSMIDPWVNDDLLIDDCVCYGSRKAEPNPTAAARIDKSVLWPGIEGIFPVYQFGMEHDVALLGGMCSQIGQSFPVHQVF